MSTSKSATPAVPIAAISTVVVSAKFRHARKSSLSLVAVEFNVSDRRESPLTGREVHAVFTDQSLALITHERYS